jgi:CRP/FNR family cyclic AMP-dependent transcriptional regulator
MKPLRLTVLRLGTDLSIAIEIHHAAPLRLFTQGNHVAVITEDCTLCVMSRTDVERLIREQPSVSLRLLELLATRLDAAEERLADVAYKSVPARIATTLLRLAGDEVEPVKLSHQDIADMVGTYRETATRILNEMRADGLVELNRMRIEIADADRLEDLAEELV